MFRDPADCELGVDANKTLIAANIRLFDRSGVVGAGVVGTWLGTGVGALSGDGGLMCHMSRCRDQLSLYYKLSSTYLVGIGVVGMWLGTGVGALSGE